MVRFTHPTGWDGSAANWWNGSSDVVWPNTTSDGAIIGAGSGAAGAITVSGTRTLNGLTFNAPGSGNYTLSAGTLSFDGAAPTITANADATISSVIVGNDGLTKSGSGALTLSGNVNLSGTFTISGGTLSQPAGNSVKSSQALVDGGTYDLSGTGNLSAKNEYVGYSGTGTFTQSGGTNTIASNLYMDGLHLGANTLASGTYSLGGGLLSAGYEWVGDQGTGIFTHSAGTNTPGALYVGNYPGSSGTYNLSGSGQLSAGGEWLGNSGTGTFTQSGGTNAVAGTLYLGNSPGSTGTYNLSGSGQLSAESEYLGYSGTGTFTQSGGTNAVAGTLYLGNSSGSSGTYNLSGSGQLSAEFEVLGYSGTGTFTQSGGTNTIAHTLQLGGMGGSSVYTLTGSGNLVVGPSGQISIYSSGRFEWLYADGLTCPSLTTYDSGMLAIGFDFDMAALTGSAPFHGTTVSGLRELGITNGATATLTGTTSVSLPSLAIGTSAGGGTFTQSGGANDCGRLSLGYDSGATGTYNLSGSGQLSATSEYLGYSGFGIFTQSGGANRLRGSGVVALYVGYSTGASGTYNFSDGELSVSGGNEYVAYSGSGTFTQSGGTNTITPGMWTDGLYVGYNSGAIGAYSLSGSGQLSAWNEYVGYAGAGTFNQSGGTNNISGNLSGNPLYLGYSPGASGTYNLDGGSLSATSEYVGYSGSGTFRQSGGTNTATFVSVNSLSTYVLSGGTLQLSGGFDNAGTLDCDHGSATISSSSSTIVNFSHGPVVNAESTSLIILANSLLIVPPGFDPAVVFGHYINDGMTHTAGTTLTVMAGKTIGGWGSIDDPVNCQGTIAAGAGGFINLNAGLALSGSGRVDLGRGWLRVDDATSGVSGAGSLTARQQYIGYSSTATFSQSGGTNSLSDLLYLGYNSGAQGTYNLSGAGQLATVGENGEMLGYSGTGTLNQSGGTNSPGTHLWLGYNAGASGIYNLTGTGQLSANVYEIIGFSGSGTFTQSGGTNSISDWHSSVPGLYLGMCAGSSGTYNLNGGVLLTPGLARGDGTAAFNFGGGTLKAVRTFATDVPITINAGGAIIDTNGYNLTVTSGISGGGSLSKISSGTLILSGNNNYSGGTRVIAGTVRLDSTTALGTGELELAGGSAVVDLNGSGPGAARQVKSLTSTIGLAPGSASGTITDSSSGSTNTTTLDVQNAASKTYAGLIEDDPEHGRQKIGLKMSGTGEVVLTSAPRYAGDTEVASGGTLSYLATTGTTKVDGNATLKIDSGAKVNVGGTIDPFSMGAAHTAVKNNSAGFGGDAGFNLADNTTTTISSLSGTGTTSLGANATLNTGSLVQDVVTIAMGTRSPFSGASSGSSGGAAAVPEPGTCVLLAAGAVCLLPLVRRRKKGDRHRGGEVSPTAETTCATEPVPLFRRPPTPIPNP